MKTLVWLLVLLPWRAWAHETDHAPSTDAGPGDYVVELSEMTRIEAGKGETIHLLHGRRHGFESLSFILTETAPGGGPPLHTHDSEEAHVLTSGTMAYVIGDQRFTVSAPYILRVPANTPHTFINAGDTPLSLTAVFGSADYTFKPIAANPLQEPETAPSDSAAPAREPEPAR